MPLQHILVAIIKKTIQFYRYKVNNVKYKYNVALYITVSHSSGHFLAHLLIQKLRHVSESFTISQSCQI